MAREIIKKVCIFWAFACMAWAPLLALRIRRGDLIFRKGREDAKRWPR